MGFELVVGIAADSLAVLADAAHMLGDAAALALALAAAWIAGRPASPERTFGSMRAEILAALANGVLLVALAIWILVAAVDRLRDPRRSCRRLDPRRGRGHRCQFSWRRRTRGRIARTFAPRTATSSPTCSARSGSSWQV